MTPKEIKLETERRILVGRIDQIDIELGLDTTPSYYCNEDIPRGSYFSECPVDRPLPDIKATRGLMRHEGHLKHKRIEIARLGMPVLGRLTDHEIRLYATLNGQRITWYLDMPYDYIAGDVVELESPQLAEKRRRRQGKWDDSYETEESIPQTSTTDLR